MASPSTPTHGKDAAIWRFRPNGFVGQGLNDAAWVTTGYNGADSTYLEVVIDAEATPDTFKWRADGGGWTAAVAITGAAQTIADGITITFAATTGHTLNDSWAVGWLDGEATTESTNTAQITTAASRILDPNNEATFTDDGGKTVLEVRHAGGYARFSENVGTVTVDGRYIPAAAIELVGYLLGWSFTVNANLAAASRCGQAPKEYLPGQTSFNGSANGHLIVCDTYWDAVVEQNIDADDYTFLKLFGYDPDQDGSGDQWACWCNLSGFNLKAALGETVKETVNFEGKGMTYFTANS